VNHELAPLRTVLKNGDHVEIITSDWGHPNPVWLDYVTTGKARATIRNYLKNQKLGDATELGSRMLDKALLALGSDLGKVSESQQLALLKSLRLKDWNALLTEIGLGNRVAAVVARQLVPAKEDDASRFLRFFRRRGRARPPKPGALAIRGTEGVVVTYARCCRPIPGDPILGFLSSGRGMVIHTEDCPNVSKYRKHPEQWVDVRWEPTTDGVFPVSLRIAVKNHRGVLAQVAAAIAEHEANIDTLNFEDKDGRYTTMDFTIEVKNRAHLAKVMRALRSLESIVRVNRKKG